MRIAGNGSSSFIDVPCEVASPEMIGIYRRRKSE
jgi:hypothetical protein